MPGLADLLYLGAPDPRRQLAELLAGRQQAQAAPPGPAPAPPAPVPAPADANVAAPAAQPVSAEAPAPAPVAPGAAPPPGSPPQPQALQSTPDMSASYQQLANPPNIMSLYLQMDQRNRASDQINRGLALIAANHSSPSMANAIMQSVSGGQGDAGQDVGNIMKLYQTQQMMGQQQQMLQDIPGLAQRTGYPESVVRSLIMSGQIDQLTSAMRAPEAIRSYEWAQRIFKEQHPDATQDEIEEGAQGILLQTGGGGDSATRSWRQAKVLWDRNPETKGTPYPWGTGADDSPTSFASWQGAQKAEETTQANDLTEAARLGPTYRQNLLGARKKITDIIGMKPDGSLDEAKAARLQKILGNSMAQSYINADPTKDVVGPDVQAWFGGLDEGDKELLRAIREATDEKQLIGGQGKRAPKRGAADVNDITGGLGGLRDVRKNYDEWMQGARDTIKSIDTATMNSFGAQGEADKAEDFARQNGLGDEAPSLIDESYLPGGKMYPKNKRPLPIPSDQLAQATDNIKKADNPEEARQKAIKYFARHNFDPKPLRDMVM